MPTSSEQERDARIASDESSRTTGGSRAPRRWRTAPSIHDGMRAGGASRPLRGRARGARSASRRASMPRHATQTGTYGDLRQLRREQQRAEPADLRGRQRRARRHASRAASRARCGRRRSSERCAHRRSAPATARARSAPRGGGRAPARGSAMPGSAQRERPRRALGGEHPRGQPREPRFDGRARPAAPARRAPPVRRRRVPSNCFVYQPAPRATAFHATRCGGSPGW